VEHLETRALTIGILACGLSHFTCNKTIQLQLLHHRRLNFVARINYFIAGA